MPENRFEPIRKQNLSQQLVDFFISNIESGEFPVGSRIPNEISLAEQINVSRNILRESMKILENYGILYTVNGKGTVVAQDAIANIQSMRFFERLRNDTTALELLEARLVLEPQIAFYAGKRATAADLAHLREVVAISPSEHQGSRSLDDYDFHLALAKIYGNNTLTDFLRTILYRLQDGDYASFNNHVEKMLSRKSEMEHEDILSAIESRDPIMASKVMGTHLRDRIILIKTLYRSDIDPEQLKMEDIALALNAEEQN